jgi:hypothetical protein
MSRLRFFLGVLAAWWLAIRDFFHGPPRPWRRRKAVRNGPFADNYAADQAVLDRNTILELLPRQRAAMDAEFQALIAPIDTRPRPRPRGRHR